jgi:phosphohistidine phosphatase SixA
MTVRFLEIRRHAARDPNEDRLSPEGRAQAEAVGRTLAGGYSVVFTSPAHRAAETVAWFLRGRGELLPSHDVVPGLMGNSDQDRTQERLAAVVGELMDRVPDGSSGLAVGHTPLIERAVLGLTGRRIEPLAECEGVLLKESEDGSVDVEELRIR